MFAENTHLTMMEVRLTQLVGHPVTGFYDGLKQNSSIHKLKLHCSNSNVADNGVAHEILKVYQENKNLTELWINNADLQNGGDRIVAATLRNSINLKHIDLHECNMTDEQLLPMADAIRGHRSLVQLYLRRNRIGRSGCDAIATLLEDPNSNLHTLGLQSNDIGNEGATILINSLGNNTKLRKLYLNANPIDQCTGDEFTRILCNKSNINSMYSSNHTLEQLGLSHGVGYHLFSLLTMNEGTNKGHVAIKKILKYHPNIDMEPLFEWNMEGDGERDLKALPYIISWFERAKEAIAGDERGGSCSIDAKKLSAIYQFARAMPLLFMPASNNIKGNENKRKMKVYKQ